MRSRRIAPLVAAALLTVSGCAGAEELALPDEQTDSPSESSTTSESTESSPAEEPPTDEPSTPVPDVGDCRRLPESGVLSGIVRTHGSPIDCGARHNAQTYYVAAASGKQKRALVDKDLTKVLDHTLQRCWKQLRNWTGGNAARIDRTWYGVVVGTPSAQDVKRGATWIRCDVVLYERSGSTTTLPAHTRGSLSGRSSGVDYCIRGKFTRRGTSYTICSQPHDHRSFASARLGRKSGPYPGESRVRKLASDQCTIKAKVAGVSFSGYTYPLAKNWKNGDVFAECYKKSKK